MAQDLYPEQTSSLSSLRRELAPDAAAAFGALGHAVFKEGALSAKAKQIIAVAVAHATQCPYCIKGHTGAALRKGASRAELMEAIWVAAEMRAGAAYAHSAIALAEMENSVPQADGVSPQSLSAGVVHAH